MKKLLAILASLAVCCTMFAACSDKDTSSKSSEPDSSSAAESSSVADTSSEADSSSAADSSEADSSETDSSEPESSSEPDSSQPDDRSEVPASTTPLDETVGDKAEFDSAPFDMFDKITHAQQYTVAADETIEVEEFTITSSYLEIVDGDNAYAEETDDSMGEESTLAYMRKDGKSYTIDHDLKVYFEDPEPATVEEVIYDTDFAGLADMLSEGNDPKKTEVNNVTVDGKEYTRYAFVVEEAPLYMYASDGKPVMLSAEVYGTTMTITFTRIEDTADKQYFKIPDGFAQTTAAEYYEDVDQ